MTSSKTRQIIYGLTAIVGAFSTWYFNINFIVFYQGFPIGQFLTDNYVNPASASISNDLWVAVFTFLFWSFVEARRIAMRGWWLYLLLTFSVAVAVAFPFFLLMRERHLARQS